MKSELELRQLFKNNSDCYADTWDSSNTNDSGCPNEGEVIQAMTEDSFIKLLKELNLIPVQITSYVETPIKQMDDYEFNLHKHWKDEPRQDDYDGTIKHFQD